MKLVNNLDLDGFAIKNGGFEQLAEDPIAPFVGQTYFNTVAKRTKSWNGDAWDVLEKGATGDKGWTPDLRDETYEHAVDDIRIIRKLYAYINGEGTAPIVDVGKYLKSDGTYTAIKADAMDYKGSTIAETNVTIKNKYEANANTNAFTDVLKAKLDNLDNTKDVDKEVLNATKFKTPRKINNVDFDGTAPITIYDNTKQPAEVGKGLSQENYTTAEKSKLAGLEASKFKGQYVSLAALIADTAAQGIGNYAYVDEGIGTVIKTYVWDSTDNAWELQSGTSTTETPASVKAKYESNPDTNVFSDTEKSKLASITAIFTTALNTSYDSTVTWISTNGANLIAHLSRTDNPHSVTKTQVGLGNVDNTSDANKPLSVLAVTPYNAASGVDTPLTNAMSPVQMFQNLQKHNDNQFTNSELANPLGAIMIAYPDPLGVLIKTDIVTSIDQFFKIDLKAHSYSPTELPIDIHIEGEVRPGAMDFYNNLGLSKGKDLDGTMYMLQIDGKVCLWFPLTFIRTFYVDCFTSDSRKNRVTSIELTSATIPTADVGGIPTTLINVTKTILDNGLASNLILGNGTPKPVSDFIPSNQKGVANGVIPSNASNQIDQIYLPSYVDDIIEGYKSGANFYKEVGLTTLITGETGKIYVDLTTGQNSKQYRWSGSTYIQITNGLIASTDDVVEGGSNLYFTVARVLTTVLTGFSSGAGTVAATDTILQAINKIVGNILAQQTALNLKAPIRYTTITAIAANTTLALTDENTYLRISGTRNITVPPNSTVAFPIGSRIDFLAVASAIATFVQGSGVTINKKTDLILTGFGACTLVKTGTDTWDLIGNN